MGHFGISESVQSRDLSLSQPFWDILATMAYPHNLIEVNDIKLLALALKSSEIVSLDYQTIIRKWICEQLS